MSRSECSFGVSLKPADLSDSATVGRAVAISLMINLLAFSYCALHGMFSPTGDFSLMVSLTWALRYWGIWPLLFPLCLLFISAMAQTGRFWQSLIASVSFSLFLFVLLTWLFEYPNQSFIGGLIQQFPIVVGSFTVILVLSILRIDRPEAGEAVDDASPSKIDGNAIVWGRSFRNYVELHTTHGSQLLRSTLKGLLAEMNSTELVQIHRSFFVHQDSVVKVTRRPNGRCAVLLSSGEKLPVGNAYRDSIRLFDTR